MDTFYIWDGGDNSDGLTFTKAKQTVAQGIALGTNGDLYLVAKDHEESQGSNLSLSFPSTGLPKTLMTVDRATEDYAVATAINIDVSGGAYDITLNGAYAVYGMKFSVGDDFQPSADRNEGGGYLEDVVVVLANGSRLAVGATHCMMKNITLEVNASSTVPPLSMTGGVRNEMDGVTLAGDFSNLSSVISGGGIIRNSDFSGLAATTELLENSAALCDIINCQLPSSFAGLIGGENLVGRSRMHGCDASGGANKIYRFEESVDGLGTVISDASVYRSGGASDGNTPISWKIDTDTYAHYADPFCTGWIAGYIDTTGYPVSHNFDCFVTCDTALNTEDVWVEVEYYDDDASVVKSMETTRSSLDDWKDESTTALTSSSETWTGEKTNEYRLRATVSVDRDGPWRARVCIAKASLSALYMCPKIDVSEA